MRPQCIGEEMLMDYVEGRLPERQRSRVERHLVGCERCLEEAALVWQMLHAKELVEMEPVPETVTNRAVEGVGRLRSETIMEKIVGNAGPKLGSWAEKLSAMMASRAPGLVVVRGSKTVIGDDLILLKKSFVNLDVDMEIEKKRGDQASIRVMLSRNSIPDETVRVTLFSEARELSSYLLEGAGAVFDDIPFGRYMFVFSRNGKRVGEYPFELKEMRNDGK
jgi:hypothetical protein